MSVLHGHPTGGPFSHHAALAHLEAGRLAAFCVPWMPQAWSLRLLALVPALGPKVRRLSRRQFAPLASAPLVQGRAGEFARLARRLFTRTDERLSYEANDWLMHTMADVCRRSDVTAVHAYEDCALLQFEAARGLGKACIYDMPIGYYPAWEATRADLMQRYSRWLPRDGGEIAAYVRPDQKRREMALADLVLAPSSFAKSTILDYHPDKTIAVAPYGADLAFWHPQPRVAAKDRPLRFIYAGQISLRKNAPGLIEAWQRAALRDAELHLVGAWQLADEIRDHLPAGVTWYPPCSLEGLRAHFWSADVFVFPSMFDGFGLVVTEAMACGLPAIASHASCGPDVITAASGRVVATGDDEQLVESLRWFADNRERVPAMGIAARADAERFSWPAYRRRVSGAVAPFV